MFLRTGRHGEAPSRQQAAALAIEDLAMSEAASGVSAVLMEKLFVQSSDGLMGRVSM
jgi:hypothetical protein